MVKETVMMDRLAKVKTLDVFVEVIHRMYVSVPATDEDEDVRAVAEREAMNATGWTLDLTAYDIRCLDHTVYDSRIVERD